MPCMFQPKPPVNNNIQERTINLGWICMYNQKENKSLVNSLYVIVLITIFSNVYVTKIYLYLQQLNWSDSRIEHMNNVVEPDINYLIVQLYSYLI